MGGDVIPRLDGLRKMRWSAKGKGKRGGARIIYLYLPEAEILYLVYLFSKGDITDLTQEQKKQVAKLVAATKEAYKK